VCGHKNYSFSYIWCSLKDCQVQRVTRSSVTDRHQGGVGVQEVDHWHPLRPAVGCFVVHASAGIVLGGPRRRQEEEESSSRSTKHSWWRHERGRRLRGEPRRQLQQRPSGGRGARSAPPFQQRQSEPSGRKARAQRVRGVSRVRKPVVGTVDRDRCAGHCGADPSERAGQCRFHNRFTRIRLFSVVISLTAYASPYIFVRRTTGAN
jgi:hypothetical protein